MEKWKIRDDTDQYMRGLKSWLSSTKGEAPEEMSAFFAARLEGYEEHMKLWEKAYRKTAEMIPKGCRSLLDLGCGTGLELDEILKRRRDISVTGIDLCKSMLDRLKEKHPQVDVICADYFLAPFGENRFDAAVSVESLHHFDPVPKRELFRKIRGALKDGGNYIECDYIACCEEEEELLKNEYDARMAGIAPDTYIHFDRPLTLEHEMRLMNDAGFSSVRAVDSIQGATFIVCAK